jgi:hypothetical protein
MRLGAPEGFLRREVAILPGSGGVSRGANEIPFARNEVALGGCIEACPG